MSKLTVKNGGTIWSKQNWKTPELEQMMETIDYTR